MFSLHLLLLLLPSTLCTPILQFPRSRPVPPTITTSSTPVPGALNVHIQPHAHLDLGWLKTFDEYLMGYNNSIQTGAVRWTYQSVIASLLRDPNRRFITVEMGFLFRWLDTQPPSVLSDVQQLIAADRLQITNGGWSMHDEATVHYLDAADQMSLGSRLVSSSFGPSAASRVGWSIDPFGHSAAQGVLTSQLGQGGFFYGRLDYQEQAQQITLNATEYVWRPSASLGTSAQVFAGSNVHGYDPPVLTDSAHPLFEWDIVSDAPGRPPLLLGPLQPFDHIDGYNVDAYISATLALANKQAAYILPDEVDGTRHISWQFGSDFNYIASEMWFTSIDALISAVNGNQSRVHLLYSTPKMYLDAKLSQRTAWPLKPPTSSGISTDQFPYATNPHWVWSGYFSSRPALKGYVRSCSALYSAARQLQAVTGGAPVDALGPSNPLYALERALATSQHHDAVTGTARQHVSYDYAAKLSSGMADAGELLSAALASATGYTDGSFTLCLLANATISCPSLDSPSLAAPPTLILLYNAGSLPRLAAPVRIPVGLPPGIASWVVNAGSAGAPATPAQLLPASAEDSSLRTDYYGAPAQEMAWLVWQAGQVPALGWSSFILTPVATQAGAPSTVLTPSQQVPLTPTQPDTVLSNGVLTLTLSGSTGLVSALSDAASSLSLPLAQQLYYYHASPGCPLPPLPCDIPNDGTGLSSYGQSATTYIFRPNSSEQHPLPPLSLSLIRGPFLTEARQTFPSASLTLRLWANATSLETEWTAGPLPLSDGWGKELMLSWTVGAPWGAGLPAPSLYHDSQGRELQRRVLNARAYPSNLSSYEPIAANLYPVVARAVLVDEGPGGSGARLTLAVDRAQGCAALVRGRLECLLHRRHLTTTFLGMGEVLNETGLDANGSGLVVRGQQWLRLDAKGSSALPAAALVEAALLPLGVFTSPLPANTTPAVFAAGHTLTASVLAPSALPASIALVTLQSLGNNSLLLRLAHTFAAGEDSALSVNATVALGRLFAPSAHLQVTGVQETSLGGVTPLSSVKPWTLRVQGEAGATTLPVLPPVPVGPDFAVTLAPMEVRTFVCTLAGGG